LSLEAVSWVEAVDVSHGQRVQQLGREHPDAEVYRHVAIAGDEPSFTWSWLDRRSNQLAGALAARGLREGDRLGLGLRNSPQFLVATFAAWKLGAVPVPVRWDVPDWELARLRDVIQPRVYLSPEDLAWIDATADLEVPELPDVVAPHTHGICSSGSTGTPKVILSAAPGVQIPAFGAPFAEEWGPVERPQQILVLAPMYHINAFTTLYSLLAGDHVTVLEKFDAARAIDVIERHRITTFTATPTMLQRMADVPEVDERDLSSLQWILQGAAPMPPSLVHRWAGLIGAEKILMAYGMSEGIGITALRADEWREHEGSVGRGMRETEVRVLDGEGCDVPPGEIGDIYLRSPSYGGSLYLGEAPQLPSTDDGFQSVGDVGYVDADGYLYVVDRRVDMIVTGGANVFPAEVESALVDHPKVADVVVIGLQDPEWGRRVHVLIEPADPCNPPTLEEIRAYAKTRLAAYKAPRSIEILETIPRSQATKVNRGRLVEARGG
jgi:bile acid-coenzyme A ligase